MLSHAFTVAAENNTFVLFFFLKEKPNLLAFNGSLLPYLYHLMNSGYELCIIHPIFFSNLTISQSRKRANLPDSSN